MPFDTLDIPAVTLELDQNVQCLQRHLNPRTSQNALLSTLLESPYSNRRIVAGSREPAIVRTEAQTTNSLPMSRPCVQVVHVRLKVLDDAALICRREVGT